MGSREEIQMKENKIKGTDESNESKYNKFLRSSRLKIAMSPIKVPMNVREVIKKKTGKKRSG